MNRQFQIYGRKPLWTENGYPRFVTSKIKKHSITCGECYITANDELEYLFSIMEAWNDYHKVFDECDSDDVPFHCLSDEEMKDVVSRIKSKSYEFDTFSGSVDDYIDGSLSGITYNHCNPEEIKKRLLPGERKVLSLDEPIYRDRLVLESFSFFLQTRMESLVIGSRRGILPINKPTRIYAMWRDIQKSYISSIESLGPSSLGCNVDLSPLIAFVDRAYLYSRIEPYISSTEVLHLLKAFLNCKVESREHTILSFDRGILPFTYKLTDLDANGLPFR